METATVLYGSSESPHTKKDPVLMMFLSDKGKRHQQDFAHLPIYVGQYTW